jgi:hypothetical protein
MIKEIWNEHTNDYERQLTIYDKTSTKKSLNAE